MEREQAFAAVKACFEEAVQSMSISPEPSFLTGEAARGERCLCLRKKQINDEEFAALLRSLQKDTYFRTLDVSANLVTNLGARELANAIAAGATVLETVNLENNLIKEKGGQDIEQSKVAARARTGRKWTILLTGNPMSDELIARLKAPDTVQHSRRASVAESLPSIKDTSPIQRTSPTYNWKPFEPRSRGSNSDELFDGEMHVSELKGETNEVPRLEVPELGDTSPDDEIANYRSRELSQVPAYLAQSLTIKRLALACNRIIKIENLPESLEALELRKNAITAIAGLDGLTHLRYLDLSENKLTHIAGLDTNLALREISFAGNSIKQISGLEHLRELRRLNLANNNISGFMNIRTISMNVQLKLLILMGNPLYLQAKYKTSVSNLLPRLVLLDFVPVFSWKGESFKKTQERMSFFSIDFTSSATETSRSKVTPRFPERQLTSASRRNALFLEEPQQVTDPYEKTRPVTTTRAQAWAPRLKKANATVQAAGSFPATTTHRAQKSTSVHTTFFMQSDTDDSHPLTSKEKEDGQRFLRTSSMFRGVKSEVLRVLLEQAERRHALKGDVIQEGDVVVSRMLVIIRGKVQWKSATYSGWSCLFAESLVVPTDSEDAVVCIDAADFIIFERSAVNKVLEVDPESKNTLYRNYDNIQLAGEKPMLVSSETPLAATQKRATLKRAAAALPALNLKQLIKSETSQTLGLTTISLDERTTRLQSDIDRMLTSDPLKPELTTTTLRSESAEEWKEAVKGLETHITELMGFYQKETRVERDKAAVDEEAKEFVLKGPSSHFEFMALHRPTLRECVEQAFMVPLSESISEIKPEGWIEEYVSVLSHGEDEALKHTLDSWLLALQRDMGMCILALSNLLLVGNDETAVSSHLASYKDAIDELDLSEIRANPKEYLAAFCGQRVANPDIAEKVRQIIEITDKGNYCKECLDRLLAAVESKDTATVEALQAELVQEGVLTFSLLPSQLFLTKKKDHESTELKARAWIHQNSALSPDSSVTSGAASRSELY